MTMAVIFFAVLMLCFILTALISRKLIPFLKSKKMGQVILDIGPRWHKNKEGTPTMGGLAFIIASVAAGMLGGAAIAYMYGFETALPMFLTLGFAVLSGLIGMIDDSAKLRKKQNEGLTASQKYLCQLVISGAYLAAMMVFCHINTCVDIPFTSFSFDMGVIYYVFALLLLTGMLNSVNLTDGIDGLASSVTFAVGLFFALVSFASDKVVNSESAAVISALLIGSALGFLIYNFYPAKVFMGDTGSLFLGGLVVGCAFVINKPLIIIPVGIIYICETVSDILQVTYFKLTHGKRLFKMAPIHHHFEKSGWSEIKIVCVFTLITALFCLISWLDFI